MAHVVETIRWLRQSGLKQYAYKFDELDLDKDTLLALNRFESLQVIQEFGLPEEAEDLLRRALSTSEQLEAERVAPSLLSADAGEVAAAWETLANISNRDAKALAGVLPQMVEAIAHPAVKRPARECFDRPGLGEVAALNAEAFLASGCVPKLVGLLENERDEVVCHAADVVSEFVASDHPTFFQELLDAGFLERIQRLVRRCQGKVVATAVSLLVDVAFDFKVHEAIARSGILPDVARLLEKCNTAFMDPSTRQSCMHSVFHVFARLRKGPAVLDHDLIAAAIAESGAGPLLIQAIVKENIDLASAAASVALRVLGEDFVPMLRASGALDSLLRALRAVVDAGGVGSNRGGTRGGDQTPVWHQLCRGAPGMVVACGAVPEIKRLLANSVQRDHMGPEAEQRCAWGRYVSGVQLRGMQALAWHCPDEFVDADFVGTLLTAHSLVSAPRRRYRPNGADEWLYALGQTHRQQLLDLDVPAELLEKPKPEEYYVARKAAAAAGGGEGKA